VNSSLIAGLRRRPLTLTAVAVLIVIVVACLAAPLLAPSSPDAQNLMTTLQGPSASHWLGTDELGRDILSRLLYGGRATLAEAALVLVITLGIGIPMGLASGFIGGWTDRVLMYLADIGLALPVIVLVLLVVAIFNGNLQAAMIGLGILLVPPLSRVIRSAALTVRNELYVDAARVSGVRAARIIVRHILPRIRGTIITQATLIAAIAVLFTTGLAYLGFGPTPPNPSWGGMISEASQVLPRSPWLLIAAGGITGITILCLGLAGDGLRDVSVALWTPSGVPGGHGGRAAPRSQGGSGGDRPPEETLLSLRSLTISYDSVPVVSDLDLDLRPGEITGLVGESGCGKTSVARAVLGLLRGGKVSSGAIWFDGENVTRLSGARARRYRGGEVAFIAQEPVASLDPTCRVGHLVAQAVRFHSPVSAAQARDRVRELFEMVQLPDPEQVARRYPHELSGGMAQRVAIARALAGNPRLLIADEPTTSLDVTLQAEILALLRSLQRQTGMTVLIVSHDWQVVESICDRVVVMYAGQVVETSPTPALLESAAHPYTQLLLAASPAHAPEGARSLPVIAGSVPPPADWPVTCRFENRCPHAADACRSAAVPLSDGGADRQVRCVRVGSLGGRSGLVGRGDTA
jgi:peptide/nickel transport system permease protein